MANKWMLWVVMMMVAGMVLLSSCSGKDPNPAKEQEQTLAQTLTERQKAFKEVINFIDNKTDKAGEKAGK